MAPLSLTCRLLVSSLVSAPTPVRLLGTSVLARPPASPAELSTPPLPAISEVAFFGPCMAGLLGGSAAASVEGALRSVLVGVFLHEIAMRK